MKLIIEIEHGDLLKPEAALFLRSIAILIEPANGAVTETEYAARIESVAPSNMPTEQLVFDVAPVERKPRKPRESKKESIPVVDAAGLTMDEVRLALKGLVDKHGREAALGTLHKYAPQFADIKPEQMVPLMAEIKAFDSNSAVSDFDDMGI
jgi:hypothetical protein